MGGLVNPLSNGTQVELVAHPRASWNGDAQSADRGQSGDGSSQRGKADLQRLPEAGTPLLGRQALDQDFDTFRVGLRPP
jgi:hypothetical protein